jgi:flagellar motor switch protein FliM
MDPQLSQKEIDGYFRSATNGEDGGKPDCVPFDFRRLDRIPQSQVSAVRSLQETFVRTLSETLSVYLRSDVSGDLISVEQLPYGDFIKSLSSPTCIAYLAMPPYDGYSLVEVNQSLLAPALDRVLGGNGKLRTSLERELTDIEQDVLVGFWRHIAHDLSAVWKPTVPMEFTLESLETAPGRSKLIPQNAAVVTIAMELHIGEDAGLMNLAIPSVALKAMRKRFDQKWAFPKSKSREREQHIRQKIARELMVGVECTLSGATIRLRDLLGLEAGQILELGIPIDSTVTALVNGQPHFQGEMAVSRSKTAMIVRERL